MVCVLFREIFLNQFSSCCSNRNQSDGDGPKPISAFVAFFLLINYQMVAGFLGIPFAFFHGGLLAGALNLLVISFVTWSTAVWTLEVMARAQV